MKKVLRYAMDDFLKYIERNKFVTDLATNRQIECDTVFQMDDETYELYLRYHFSTCERQDLIGMSHHTLDILRKESK